MIKRTAVVLAAVVPLTLAGCGSNGSSSATAEGQEKLIVGVVAPTTGVGAEFGEQFKKGIELAVKDLGAAEGVDVGDKTVSLDIRFCDDVNESANSVVCGRKLASDGAKIVFTATTVASLPISGFNAKQGFLLLGSSQAPALTSEGNDMVIRAYPDPVGSDTTFAKRVFTELNAAGKQIKTAAILELNNDLGAAYRENFTNGWKAAGGTITQSAPYETEGTDFAPQLQRLLADDPDALVLTTICSTSSIVMTQARQLGFKGPFINSSACAGGDALTKFIKPEQAGDVYTAVFRSSFTTGDDVLPFIKAYETAYGTAPTQVSAAMGYLDVHWTIQALKEVGGSTDLKALRDAFGPAQAKLGDANTFGLTDFDAKTGNSSGILSIGYTSPSTGGALTKFGDE